MFSENLPVSSEEPAEKAAGPLQQGGPAGQTPSLANAYKLQQLWNIIWCGTRLKNQEVL